MDSELDRTFDPYARNEEFERFLDSRDLPCGICEGTQVVDSGGFLPWGEAIFVKCGYCNGTGKEPAQQPDPEEKTDARLDNRSE